MPQLNEFNLLCILNDRNKTFWQINQINRNAIQGQDEIVPYKEYLIGKYWREQEFYDL